MGQGGPGGPGGGLSPHASTLTAGSAGGAASAAAYWAIAVSTELVLRAVVNLRLPQVAGLPDHPLGLLPLQLVAQPPGLTKAFLLHQAPLPSGGELLPGELPLLPACPVYRLAQLADGGLDPLGVVAVAVLGGLELGDLPPGVPGGGVHVPHSSGPGQLGVGGQGGVAVAPAVLGELKALRLLLRLLPGLLHHLRQTGLLLLLLPHQFHQIPLLRRSGSGLRRGRLGGLRGLGSSGSLGNLAGGGGGGTYAGNTHEANLLSVWRYHYMLYRQEEVL